MTGAFYQVLYCILQCVPLQGQYCLISLQHRILPFSKNQVAVVLSAQMKLKLYEPLPVANAEDE